MFTSDYSAPLVRIEDLYRLAESRRLTQIRDVLSPLSTERLLSLAKLLGAELPRLRGHDETCFRQIAQVVAEIYNTRASGEASSRLLGGVA